MAFSKIIFSIRVLILILMSIRNLQKPWSWQNVPEQTVCEQDNK